VSTTDKYTALTDRSAATGGTVSVTASLTNNSFVTGSAYDNGTNLDSYGSIDCAFASFTPSTNGYLQFFLVQSLDGGSTFDDAPSSTNAGTHMLVGQVTLTAAASAKHVVVPKFDLPPGQFKICIKNVTGATMSATPGTLKLYTFNLQNV
jgi:hypothetical protein